MNNKLERKTVFLYPDFGNLPREDVFRTNILITKINFVVNSANDLIRQILSGGNFSFLNCLPSVTLQSVFEEEKADIDCNNVRICITGYNDIDYSANYKKLVHEYQSGRADISHLVAIHITDKSQKAQFIYDKQGNFDVIIKTDLDHLRIVLLSIMLDISLYHYFLLSDELTFRRDFNKIKFHYIFSNDLNEQYSTLYGLTLNEEEEVYLPISYNGINKLERRTNPDSRKDLIQSLINDYAHFLFVSLSVELIVNERGSIEIGPKKEKIHNYSILEKYINLNYACKDMFLLVPDNVTESDTDVVIQLEQDNGMVKSWVNKDFENIKGYQLIRVTGRKD